VVVEYCCVGGEVFLGVVDLDVVFGEGGVDFVGELM